MSTCLVPESQPLTAAFLALLVEVPDLGSEPIKYSYYVCLIALYMMTSSNANIFRVTGPL